MTHSIHDAAACLECGGESEVQDTRQSSNKYNRTGTVRRIRLCIDCGQKWATLEIRQSDMDDVFNQALDAASDLILGLRKQ
jgi:transcriptional regulator NrdR family protein